MKVFIRQPFTESSEAERRIIQSVIDVITGLQEEIPFVILTDTEAQTGESFRVRFEELTGQRFTAPIFRRWRLSLLAEADAMVIIRTGLSESSAFEVAYNIYGGRRVPMLFCVWEHSPIKTTLLSELVDLCPANYVTFGAAAELKWPLREFLAAS